MSDLTQFDHYLQPSGPAALVIREHLVPVEGADGVLFPATYAAGAAGSGFPGGYNIDPPLDSKKLQVTDGKLKLEYSGVENPALNGKNVCLVDSVGSQANRIEPLFKDDPYKSLVPQVIVTVEQKNAGRKEINLLDAGHRAGDALVRCSALQQELQDAFKARLKGDDEPLAKIAPTSLVFGVWDSRDTQAKLPRLIASTIRAYDVRKLTRSAQYVPAARYLDKNHPENNILDEPADKASKDAYSERGFLDVPATGSHGGVIADGGVRREAVLALAALRLLHAGNDENRTLALRRYILGLALTAFTYRATGYLRQGCILVLDAEPPKPHEFNEVYQDGKRQPCAVTHEQCVAYAEAAAAAFGVGASQTVPFDKERAKKDLAGDGEGKKGKKGKAQAAPAAPAA